MRPQFVMGNWKMNGCLTTIRSLLAEVQAGLEGDLCSAVESGAARTEVTQLTRVEVVGGQQTLPGCVVFPPALYLAEVSDLLQDSTNIAWGAQNVYPKEAGAFTGEVSAAMLRDYGCRFVLVGHSERRSLFHEDENFVAEKFHHVKDHDMIPVLCVGEHLSEREKGLTEQVVARQLQAVASQGAHVFRDCVIAYEPVWAIGTGKTATPEQAQSVHQFIRNFVAQINAEDAAVVPILYGGSVNEGNARSLFSQPDIDGGLVGGASLNAKQFLEIVKCINSY